MSRYQYPSKSRGFSTSQIYSPIPAWRYYRNKLPNFPRNQIHSFLRIAVFLSKEKRWHRSAVSKISVIIQLDFIFGLYSFIFSSRNGKLQQRPFTLLSFGDKSPSGVCCNRYSSLAFLQISLSIFRISKY